MHRLRHAWRLAWHYYLSHWIRGGIEAAQYIEFCQWSEPTSRCACIHGVDAHETYRASDIKLSYRSSYTFAYFSTRAVALFLILTYFTLFFSSNYELDSRSVGWYRDKVVDAAPMFKYLRYVPDRSILLIGVATRIWIDKLIVIV